MANPRNKGTGKGFAQALRQLRQEKGLSQEELADRAGLHRTYISQIERGIKSPSLRSLERIARALDVQLSTLIKKMEN